MTEGDPVRITGGEFSGCAGTVVRVEGAFATVRLSHSNDVPLAFPRTVWVDLSELHAVA